jgi:hypothetical protein
MKTCSRLSFFQLAEAYHVLRAVKRILHGLALLTFERCIPSGFPCAAAVFMLPTVRGVARFSLVNFQIRIFSLYSIDSRSFQCTSKSSA